jgi:uncharacterized protein with FMN-binding domain
MEPNRPRTSQKIITGLVVLVITVVIVFGAKALQTKKPDMQTAAQTTSSPKPAVADTSATSTDTTPTVSTYKDGTYTATGKYNSPGGTETITVHVTLASDAVTETSAESGANDPTAQEFQDDFISGYKALVVGKNISSISLSHVSGSSLTSQGFNSALAQIKSQAKSS